MSVRTRDIKRTVEMIRGNIYEQLNAKTDLAIGDRSTAHTPQEIGKANTRLRAISAVFTTFNRISREFKDEILRRKKHGKKDLTPSFSDQRQAEFSREIDTLISMLRDQALGFREDSLRDLIKDIREYQTAAIKGFVSAHDIELYRNNQTLADRNVKKVDIAARAHTKRAAEAAADNSQLADDAHLTSAGLAAAGAGARNISTAGPGPGISMDSDTFKDIFGQSLQAGGGPITHSPTAADLQAAISQREAMSGKENKDAKEDLTAATGVVGKLRQVDLKEHDESSGLSAEEMAVSPTAVSPSKPSTKKRTTFGPGLREGATEKTVDFQRLQAQGKSLLLEIAIQADAIDVLEKLARMEEITANSVGEEARKLTAEAASYFNQAVDQATEINKRSLEIKQHIDEIQKNRVAIASVGKFAAEEFELFKKMTTFTADDIALLQEQVHRSKQYHVAADKSLLAIKSELKQANEALEAARKAHQDARALIIAKIDHRVSEQEAAIKNILGQATAIEEEADSLNKEAKLRGDNAMRTFRGIRSAQAHLDEVFQQEIEISTFAGLARTGARNARQEIEHARESYRIARETAINNGNVGELNEEAQGILDTLGKATTTLAVASEQLEGERKARAAMIAAYDVADVARTTHLKEKEQERNEEGDLILSNIFPLPKYIESTLRATGLLEDEAVVLGQRISKMDAEIALFGGAAVEQEDLRRNLREINSSMDEIRRQRQIIFDTKSYIETVASEAVTFRNKKPFSRDDIQRLTELEHLSFRITDAEKAHRAIAAELDKIRASFNAAKTTHQDALMKHFSEVNNRLIGLLADAQRMSDEGIRVAEDTDKTQSEAKLKVDAALNAFKDVQPAQKHLHEIQQQNANVSRLSEDAREEIRKLNQEINKIRAILKAARESVDSKNSAELSRTLTALSTAGDPKINLDNATRALDSAKTALSNLNTAYSEAVNAQMNDLKQNADLNAAAALDARNRVEQILDLVRTLASEATKKASDARHFTSDSSKSKVDLAAQEAKVVQDLVSTVEIAASSAKEGHEAAQQAAQDTGIALQGRDLGNAKAYFEASKASRERSEKQRLIAEQTLKLAQDARARVDGAHDEARAAFLADIKKKLDDDEAAIHVARSATDQAAREAQRFGVDGKSIADAANDIFGRGAFTTGEVQQRIAEARHHVTEIGKLSAEAEYHSKISDEASNRVHREKPAIQEAFLKADLDKLQAELKIFHHARVEAETAQHRALALRNQAATARDAVIAARDAASVAYMAEIKRQIDDEAARAKAAQDRCEYIRQNVEGYAAGMRRVIGDAVSRFVLPPAQPHIREIERQANETDLMIANTRPHFQRAVDELEITRQAVAQAALALGARDLKALEDYARIAHDARLAVETARDASNPVLQEVIRRYGLGELAHKAAGEAFLAEYQRLAGQAANLEAVRQEQARQAAIVRQQQEQAARQTAAAQAAPKTGTSSYYERLMKRRGGTP